MKTGTTRIVFEFEQVVVKVPNITRWLNFLQGLVGNMNESRTWRWNSGKFEKGTSHLLCPVVWCSWGGWILIMKKAKTLTEKQWESIDNISEFKRSFGGDDTMANYGYYQNRLVKIDYANINNYDTNKTPPKGRI